MDIGICLVTMAVLPVCSAGVERIQENAESTLVPSEYLIPAGGKRGEHGLKAEYFDNKELKGKPVVVRVDKEINFHPGWMRDRQLDDDFSVRWTGKIIPRRSKKTLAIGVASDDGMRLHLNGKRVIDSWHNRGLVEDQVAVDFEPGKPVDIKIEYYESEGAECCMLRWGDYTPPPPPPAAVKLDCYRELPLRQIKPAGWIKRWLELQRDGLTGHLKVAGYPFNTVMWNGKSMRNEPDPNDWASYEQCAYYIDALIKCGYQLDDPELIKMGTDQIDYVLSNPAPGGFLGPTHIGNTRWPQAVFFRALTALHSATGDDRIVKAIEKHYLNDIDAMREKSSAVFEGNVFGRNDCHVETMCWVYEKTGNKLMLEYAEKIYEASREDRWQSGPETVDRHHGVSYSEKCKLPMNLYMQTSRPRYLRSALGAFEKGDRDHMMIDGLISCTEGITGRRSRKSHEACVIADYSWSCGYMLMGTKLSNWGDRIERTVFNAGMGSVGKDFRTHQYLSSPNQFLAAHYSNHDEHHRNRMQYRPEHPVKCCTGNIHRYMPNYVARMWLSDGHDGLVAALYGPCTMTAKAGGRKVTIVEKTDYPFSETITFNIGAGGDAAEFPLWLRIPDWCHRASVKINGTAASIDLTAGRFAKLARRFKNGDVVVLTLPMKIRTSSWPDTGIGIERGPLVFSYPIPSKIVKVPHHGSGDPELDRQYPSLDITPTAPWNWAITTLAGRIPSEARVTRKPMTLEPWTVDNAPITVTVKAKQVKDWKLIKRYEEKFKLDCVYTPHLPQAKKVWLVGEETELTLVPMGATYIRLTVFPYAPE